MPAVVQSKPREIAHTLPAREPETPRSAFDGISSAGRESTRPLQRTLMEHAQERRGAATNDGTCPAPERQPQQPKDRTPENDGTCPAPEHSKSSERSLLQRLGDSLKDGLSRIGIIRRELPCE
jgi:hypothetical protein